MEVEYVGSVTPTHVPSAAGAEVVTGGKLAVSEAEAAALLMVPALWRAADAEAEAVTPGFAAAFAMVGGIVPFDPAAAYTGGVIVTEGGLQYRSVYASLGETPKAAKHCWQPLAIVNRVGIESQLVVEPVGSLAPNVNLGTKAGDVIEGGAEANTLYGANAGENLTTGAFNTLIGQNAGQTTSTGGANTCVGSGAGKESSTGKHNVFVGAGAGNENNGSGNVFIGWEAGANEMLASNMLIIGNESTPATAWVRGSESGKAIAFLGAAPVVRAAHPTTLAQVITILQNLGFCE